MPILEHADPRSNRTEPLVWFRRIVLFESLDPLTEIRDVKLGTGINIVWGIEEESDDDGFQPGHGVGKTTFCRLIRYCLGETAFGQETAMHEIRNTFPDGYVAAVLRVNGIDWAILRPFGHHRASYAATDVTIEQLIDDKPSRQSYPEFIKQIAGVCLDGIRSDSVLTGGASIQWGHLVAMIARDQEARYQSLWHWRSTRSASGTPRFQQPKVDALLCLRSVLGLLPDEETELQRRLQSLETQLAGVEQDINERRREPDYWTRHLRRNLRDDFSIEEAMDAPLDANDMYGLPQLVERRVSALETERDNAINELATLNPQILMAAAALQEPAEMQEQEQAAAEVTDAGTKSLLKSIEELRMIRRSITDAQYSLCKYGQISIGDCSYAQQQLTEIDDQMRAEQQQQLPATAERDQVAAELRERAARKEVLIQDLRNKLDELLARQTDLNDQRQQCDREIGVVRRVLQRLQDWEEIRSGQKPDSKLGELLGQQESLVGRQDAAKSRLANLLSAQNNSIQGIRDVYDRLVKTALSPDFTGRVRLSRDGLEFQIVRGENLSGEAFETLSILLADIAVSVLGAQNMARHPGMLLHDSPREADLGAKIYSRLLSCVADVANELRRDGECPFQYVLTTTTPPPAALRKKSTTRLKLGGDDGVLFRRQLDAGGDDKQQEFRMNGT